MKTVLFFANDTISVLKILGKENFETTTISLEKGTIVNGAIINEEALIDKLLEYKKFIGNAAHLIIDSSNFFVKIIDLPQIKKKDTLNILKNEFQISGGDEDQIYQGVVSNMGDRVNLVGYSVKAAFVEKYMSAFHSAKIKIEKIDTSVNCIDKYVCESGDFIGKTFIVNIKIGDSLLSVLFENDNLVFSARNRLMQEEGSQFYVSELYEKLSVMLQFSQSQNTGHQITNSYYLGIDQEDIIKLSNEAVLRENPILVQPLSMLNGDENRDMMAIFMYQGSVGGKEDIDFYKAAKAYLKETKVTDPAQKAKVQMLALIITVVVVAGLMAYGFIDNARLENKVEELTAYTKDVARVDHVAQIEKIGAKNAEIKADMDAINNSMKEKEENTYVSKNMLLAIRGYTGGHVELEAISYDVANKVVTITGQTANYKRCRQYAYALRNSHMFDDVIYSGFAKSDKRYEFTIRCIIVEGSENE